MERDRDACGGSEVAPSPRKTKGMAVASEGKDSGHPPVQHEPLEKSYPSEMPLHFNGLKR